MQNSKRKRGISLSHQIQQRPKSYIVSNVTQYQTKNQYHRYHHQPKTYSLPKSKVNFHYPIIYQVPQNQNYKHIIQEPPKITVPQVKQKIQNYYQIPQNKNPQINLQRYQSFQQCKQILSQKLFGNTINNRQNRFNTSIVSNISKVSTLTELNNTISNKKSSTLKMAKQVFSIKQQPIIKIPQLSTNTIKLQKQNEINKQQTLTKAKKKRDPLKLKQMENRLLQIIKICDQKC